MSIQTDDRRLADWERRTDLPLTGLALLFLAAYATPILWPAEPNALHRTFDVAARVAWAGFAIDYAVRLSLARDRRRFVRRNLFDLVVVVLPLIRPLRLLRLVTVLSSLNRKAQQGFRGRVITYVLGAATLLIFVAGLAVLDAERANPQANITSFGDAVWWALTTVTTAGGDRYPTTGQGRLVAVGLMLAGIALLGVVTASLASWFIQRVQAEEQTTRATVDDVLAEVRELRREVDSVRRA